MTENFDVHGAGLMVRERLTIAVDDVDPDVTGLVLAGLDSGRGLVRRRRWQASAGVVAAAALVVGGIAFADQNGLLGSRRSEPVDQIDVVQLEPATARGLAAALMVHTDSVGSLVAVGGTVDAVTPSADEQSMQVGAAYELPDGTKVEFDLIATTDVSQWGKNPCADMGSGSTCEQFTLSDGSPAAYLELDADTESVLPNPDDLTASVTGVIARRDDELVAIVQTVVGAGVPPLDRAELTALLEDPAVGLDTTPDLNAIGADLPDFSDEGLITTDSGSGSSSTTGPEPQVEEAPELSRGRSSSATASPR